MVDVNGFDLHPEEVEKLDESPAGVLDGLNERIGRVLGAQIDASGLTGTISIDDRELFSSVVGVEKDDPVNHPSHYTHYKGLEVIQLTEQMNFNKGNAVKYVARAGIKDQSKEIEDLEKAKWYIQREIDRIKEED